MYAATPWKNSTCAVEELCSERESWFHPDECSHGVCPRVSIDVPGQELYGPLPGYLGKERNSFCWVITSAKLKNEQTAEVAFINDYGSEDFTARLTQLNDSTYEFKHLDGSPLKVPKNGKWQKLPNLIEFKRK